MRTGIYFVNSDHTEKKVKSLSLDYILKLYIFISNMIAYNLQPIINNKPYSMKRLTIFFISILILFTGCKEQQPAVKTKLGIFTPYANSPEYHNGKLKSIKEEYFWAVEKDSQIEKGNLLTDKDIDSISWSSDFEAFYNEEGVLNKINYFDDERKAGGFWVTTIENSKIIRGDWTYKDTARYYFKVSYDEQGNFSEGERYRAMSDTLLNTYLFKTDQNGNILETITQNYLGEITYKITYRWNEEGLMTEQNNFAKGDSLTYNRRFTYNEQGYVITDDIYDGKMKVTDSYIIEYLKYDDQGNWLQNVYHYNDKPFIVIERTYIYY